jgi:hypothetical protein
MIITWRWCITNSRYGAIKIGAEETPSGTAYIIDNYGCPVRSDDLEYVINKEIDFCCPHSNRVIRPITKGLLPVGVKLPDPIVVEEREVKEEIKQEDAIQNVISDSHEEYVEPEVETLQEEEAESTDYRSTRRKTKE